MTCKKCTENRAAADVLIAALEDTDDFGAYQEMKSEMPRNTFDCECGAHLEVWSPGADVDCHRCSASYNAFGQRLRSDWRSNPAWEDDEISDLEGFELSQLAREGS